MIYAEILAGGSGTRMGNTEMPKQFLLLGDKPIVIHTIEQFLLNPQFNRVVVCCPEEWMSYMNDIIQKYLADDKDKVAVVKGGNTRNETIINGCLYIKESFGLTDEDVIITHDAVRPFISQRIINDNIKAVQKYVAVDTVVPATDTIVEAKDGETISDIPVRSYMYQGQTPQSFNIKELLKAYDKLTEEEKEILTDACKIFVMKKKEVKIVLGEVYNIKITTLHDLKLANAILMERDKK